MGGWAGSGVRQAVGLAIPLGFLKFSRGMEQEVDRLGIDYMYKAGYDPTAFVDVFERIQSLEKTKPDTIAKVFSAHPPTGDRIKRAQKEIQNGLKPLPQYVIDTSEFRNVKSRLTDLQGRRNVSDREHDRHPTLRRRTSDRAGPMATSRTTSVRRSSAATSSLERRTEQCFEV